MPRQNVNRHKQIKKQYSIDKLSAPSLPHHSHYPAKQPDARGREVPCKFRDY